MLFRCSWQGFIPIYLPRVSWKGWVRRHSLTVFYVDGKCRLCYGVSVYDLRQEDDDWIGVWGVGDWRLGAGGESWAWGFLDADFCFVMWPLDCSPWCKFAFTSSAPSLRSWQLYEFMIWCASLDSSAYKLNSAFSAKAGAQYRRASYRKACLLSQFDVPLPLLQTQVAQCILVLEEQVKSSRLTVLRNVDKTYCFITSVLMTNNEFFYEITDWPVVRVQVRSRTICSVVSQKKETTEWTKTAQSHSVKRESAK